MTFCGSKYGFSSNTCMAFDLRWISRWFLFFQGRVGARELQ